MGVHEPEDKPDIQDEEEEDEEEEDEEEEDEEDTDEMGDTEDDTSVYSGGFPVGAGSSKIGAFGAQNSRLLRFFL